jgi:hypothetical protein
MKQVKTRFYVIYSFDLTKENSVSRWKPKSKQWQMTEGDSEYEFDYLGESYENGKHRKYVADLSRKQFESFLDDICLYPEDCETGGSLTFQGWLPAISFNHEWTCNADPINCSAYVTPYFTYKGEDLTELSESKWNTVKQAILNKYGC